ncbi:N-acetyltransferase [Ramlibacter sp. USB13]|uniref:N-acetyltransferase n=1 Tax=Ramlibacter cellulosilyticus TaxID=2764187 RepID=A0A923MNM8_9BURK|nr:GNAT family N-acetyltransferase [Ramlibacter cellulosilyticus]MBC5782355.1 N-acetyltransferase [Ramlibacter cellulosilyticus]
MKQQEQAAGGTPHFVHDEDNARYELRVGNELAGQAQYRKEGNAVRLTHTEVDPKYEGQGLGSRLAAFVLDDLKSRGSKVIPSCRFMAGYVARHEKEYGELVVR